MTDKDAKKLADENADLKRRVEALERAGKPPEPFKSDWQPIDYTARMSMPPSALRAMVQAVPDGAPTGPTGMIPRSSYPSDPGDGAAVNTTGWRDPTPIGPPPGVAQADKLMDEQDRRDRAELAQRLGALKR